MRPSAGRRALWFFSRDAFGRGKPRGRDEVARAKLVGRLKGLFAASATLLAMGIAALAWYLVDQSAVLKIAVGPAGSPDVELVRKLADHVKNQGGLTRLRVLVTGGPAESGAAIDTGKADFAIVRSDLGMSANTLAVAIVRRSVLLLVVPPTANETKIGAVTDLAGKRIGVTTAEESGALLTLVLKHSGVSGDQVRLTPVPADGLRAAFDGGQIDAALIVGPATSDSVADAVAATSSGGEEPTFLEIFAKAIAERNPAYGAAEIEAGTFAGSPPRPSKSLTTLDFMYCLVARQAVSESRVAKFSELLYSARRVLAADFPGVIKVEAPSTDKDAVLVVHPGAAAYLDDTLKTFFDRYGDAIFYALIIVPIVGSAITGLVTFFGSGTHRRRLRVLDRLLAVMGKARRAQSAADLDALEDQVDKLLTTAIRRDDQRDGDVNDADLATRSFALALEQARHAIDRRRAALAAPPSGGLARD